ncbi:MAG TPA: nitrate reductase molybdenum cofactor assembly chaperone [Virgibacillus sp.]|nr:nitrate reductase molybdenum cofactor assembly chaperone [Virgibacillus sp.]
MNEDKRVILIIASHLLGYPADDFVEESKAMERLMREHTQSDEIKQNLIKAYAPLLRLSPQERKELYVETFDLKDKLGLYLTAHELGDSTKRGAALIKLQTVVKDAGFEQVEKELGDYMPMLFEFLAVGSETEEYDRLYKRLAVAVQRMANHIDEENPYASILTFLMQDVFPSPTKEEIEQLANNREEADLDELPYPLMYQ